MENNKKMTQENGEKSGENSAEQSLEFVQKYWKHFVIGFGAVIIIVLGMFYMRSAQADEQKEATTELSRILNYYNQGQYELAINGDPNKKVRGQSILGLTAIANKYSGVEPGKTAALYAANAYVELGKYSEARSYFENAMDSESKLVLIGAHAGLGVCAEADKNYKEAAGHYEDAANTASESSSKVRYQYYAGRNYEKAGDKEKAEELYRKIIDESGLSEFSGKAKTGLVRIGTIIE